MTDKEFIEDYKAKLKDQKIIVTFGSEGMAIFKKMIQEYYEKRGYSSIG